MGRTERCGLLMFGWADSPGGDRSGVRRIKFQFIVQFTLLQTTTSNPCGGPYFLVTEQESKQRTQLRGGFELFAPANKATSPKNPTRPALGVGI